MVTALATPAIESSPLEAALSAAVESAMPCPPRLREALAYAVFPGGARVRPRLCLAVARAAGVADEPLSLAAASAVELLHCATLVHDDLPCFDDAELRRGKLSVHQAYGEAMAVLVGDALIVLALDVLGAAISTRPAVGLAPLTALLRAAGARGGLVAGQAWELEPGAVDVGAYHRAKTASLFEAAAELGALSAGADPRPFARLGRSLGMAYQLADDLADRLADVAEIGKRPGRDAELGRPTAAAGSVEMAQSRLRLANAQVLAAIPPTPGEEELRTTIQAVLDALAARCRIDCRGAGGAGRARAQAARP
jgi:geranylgeranyl diphosphate synthase, type II